MLVLSHLIHSPQWKAGMFGFLYYKMKIYALILLTGHWQNHEQLLIKCQHCMKLTRYWIKVINYKTDKRWLTLYVQILSRTSNQYQSLSYFVLRCLTYECIYYTDLYYIQQNTVDSNFSFWFLIIQIQINPENINHM